MASRRIDTSIWEDSKFIEDIETIEERYLWLYLLSCPKSTSIGIFHLTIRDIIYHTGLDKQIVANSLIDLQKKGLCEYDSETKEIAIFNYPKYNVYALGKPIEDLMNKELSNVKSQKLIQDMITYIHAYINSRPNDKRINILFKILPLYETALTPLERKPLKESENNNINMNINKNINVSCHDTDNDTQNKVLSWEEIMQQLGMNEEEDEKEDDIL